MSVIVDASVALKWFLAEEGSEAAEILRRDGQLYAPDLVLPELANALWKAVRRSLIPQAQALVVPGVAAKAFTGLIPSAQLAERALAISIALNHAAYDAFYIALAELLRTEVVTADARLLRKVKRTRFSKFVAPLSP